MNLFASVEELKGIGPKTAEVLKKAGITTIRDFFYNLPKTYENFSAPTTIAKMEPGKVVIKGRITAISTHHARRRKLTITEGIIRDDTGFVKAVWFNQSYRVKQFVLEKEYYFTGNFELRNGRFCLMSPSAAEIDTIDRTSGLAPVYVAHGRIKSADFKRLINNSRDKFSEIPDFLPTVKPGVRRESLFKVHFPESEKTVREGRDYLAYEELFELILAAKLNKSENEKLKAGSIPQNIDKIKDFLADLPFTLTNAQKKATWEIIQDMEKETPMNRLLQGDVGSGKTMVAALSAYAAAKAGFQTALMAPTEVLATQHAESLSKLFAGELNIALLTGSTKRKAELKRHIKAGEVDLVIGTHALITDATEFKNLGLAIIDEQHRFGVAQRQKLLAKAHTMPHLLSMTATPIPRSLQLTIFGDLAVSVLDELPAGRQPITTKIISPVSTAQMWDAVEQELAAKHQAYYICKKIDDKGESELKSVKAEVQKIAKRFPNYNVAYLHGKMKPAEKDEIMTLFANGEIHILVSTTVVEVGVNVPNATVMVIADADQYGLSQLHQLRGRVGRGSAASYCYLVNSSTDTPTRRLREIERSQDGFYLAEVDLKLRGPGEIYGSLQHGAMDLRIASITDTKLVHRADQLIKDFIKQNYNMVEYKELSATVHKYQRLTTLN